VLLVVVVATCVALASAVGVAQLGSAAIDAHRASTAADAVALAGAQDGDAAAHRIAAANGAVIERWEATGVGAVRTVTVVVRIGRAVASARATTGP
jgi:hypothetical protein